MSTARDPRVEVLGSQRVYQGRIFDLVRESVRLPSGLRQELDFVDHPGAVAIAALDERGELLAVRQYRHAIGAWLLEIPAGRLERGESPLEAARRELEEETRHRAREWTLLRTIVPAPGFCSERIVIFLARDLEELGLAARAADDDEEFELVRRSPAQLCAETDDAKSWIAAATLLHDPRFAGA